MAGRIALEIEYPDGRRETYRFDKEVIRIGGGSEVEIRLQGLPPLYAVLKAAEDRVVIKPTEGAKVFVNGRRLILPKVLSREDVIEVGDYRIRVLGVPKPGQFENHAPTEFIELPAEIIPRLEVVEGPDKGAEFEVLGTAILGRDPTTDFTLTDPSVSRHHVKFYFDDEGDVIAEDLGGRNPMLVNGRRAPRKRLKHGDVIQVGKTKLLFKYPVSEALPEEAPVQQSPRRSRWVWWALSGAALLGILAAGGVFLANAKARQAKLRRLEALEVQAKNSPPGKRAKLLAEAESLAKEVSPLKAQELEREREFWAEVAEAESLAQSGEWARVSELVDELLELRPGEPALLPLKREAQRELWLEKVKSALSEDPAKGLGLAAEALGRYPDDPEFLELYGKALGRLKALVKDRRGYKKFLTLHRTGNPRRLLEAADSALARAPGDPVALYFRHLAELELKALDLEAKGDQARARSLWRLVLGLDPKHPLALRRLR